MLIILHVVVFYFVENHFLPISCIRLIDDHTKVDFQIHESNAVHGGDFEISCKYFQYSVWPGNPGRGSTEVSIMQQCIGAWRLHEAGGMRQQDRGIIT